MSPGKIGAQSVHAALALASIMKASPDELMMMANLTTVTLDASDQKFNNMREELTQNGIPFWAFEDSGYTEVEKNTVTVMAFLEPDPKSEERDGQSATEHPDDPS
jgi:peptidyl-tRNA hydrolase